MQEMQKGYADADADPNGRADGRIDLSAPAAPRSLWESILEPSAWRRMLTGTESQSAIGGDWRMWFFWYSCFFWCASPALDISSLSSSLAILSSTHSSVFLRCDG